MRRYWTADETETLRILIGDRIRVSNIARAMGRSLDSVRAYARRGSIALPLTHPQRRKKSATRWQRYHVDRTPPRISLARVTMQNCDVDDAPPEARPRSLGAQAFDYDGMIALQRALSPQLVGRL